MITIFFTLLVACVLLWAAQKILAAFGIGDPIATVVYVFLVVLVLFWLGRELGMAQHVALLR